MIEKEHHRTAFEQYYAMGPGRSLAKLAESLGVAPNTVKNWSTKLGWQQRLEDRERDVADAVASKVIKTEIDSRVRNKQIVQMALLQIARQVAEGNVKCSVADLDRLIRLEAFLDGEADSRQEVIARDLRGKSVTELREILRVEIGELMGLEEFDEETSVN